MITSESKITEFPVEYRSALVSLKPKRRYKRKIAGEPEIKTKLAVQPSLSPTLKPVFSKAPKPRMTRSGQPNLILRRVIAPVEFSRAMPQLPKSPLLRRVTEWLNLWQFTSRKHWGLSVRAPASHRV